MSNYLRRHNLATTHTGLTAAGLPANVVNCLLRLEEARKRGWACFFAASENEQLLLRQSLVRRETLTSAHVQVLDSRAGSEYAPVHFIKMILVGYEAMISKWGPPDPVLAEQIAAVETLRERMAAEEDESTLAAFDAGLEALKAQTPEQEREECMICSEEIKPGQMLDAEMGVLFSSKCMHAMHDQCAQGWFNAAKDDGGIHVGAGGLPNEGKGITCPKKCGGYFRREYVLNFRTARDKVVEDKEKAAEVAERNLKRKADALDRGEDSEDEDGNPVAPPPPAGDVEVVALDQRPPRGSPAVIQDWVDRKVEAGHFRLLEAASEGGATYQFIFDGTGPMSSTFRCKVELNEAGYTRFSEKAPRIALVHPEKPDKTLKAWGKLLPAAAVGA